MVAQPNNNHTKDNPVGRFMVAVGAVIEQEQTGKILLLRRADDQDWHGGEWEIDYGRLDQFEDPIAGLKRELFEETGLDDIQIHSILSAWHIFRGPEEATNELIGITYYCTTKTGAVVLSDEHSAYEWVEAAEALKRITIEGIKRDVQRFIELRQ